MKTLNCMLAALLCTAAAQAQNYTYLDRSGWQWKASSVYPSVDDDVQGLDAVHDGDTGTCWHTNYSAPGTSPERSHPHWLLVDRGDDTSEFYGLAYVPRQKTLNQCCTSFLVYLSDEDLSDTPATSYADIIDTLGEPAYSGSWEASSEEQTLNFDVASTARYVLFVHLASHNSSSSACAEFNLLAKPAATGGTNFNAVRITPADGSAPHRIALDGSNLSIAMNGTAVRLANSDITVEYMPSELARMEFERYDFGSALYEGSKKDAIDFPAEEFALTVDPAPGKVKTLTDAYLALPEGAGATLNTACQEPLSVVAAATGETVRELSVHKMAFNLVEGRYVIDKIPATTDGIYNLRIPAEYFVDADGNRSAEFNAEWDVDSTYDFVAINETEADCPTLTFSRRGGELIVGGLAGASTVGLTDAAGRTVASAAVGTGSTARISVGALPRGVYFLTAGSTTLKIIL